MSQNLIVHGIDWQPILSQLTETEGIPKFPGDLKDALLAHAGLSQHPKGDAVYQLAVEISRLTTCCHPEVIYWFSRLISLIDDL